jgi:probable HAF family extracellular repeat protein
LGVSADGRVVVGQSSSASLQRAFRWSRASGMTDLGSLGLGFSSATAANADGTVIVGSSRSTDSQEAFRWTAAEGMTGLGALPSGGWTQRANAVTPDGRVIVGMGAISSFEAFRWTATELQLLGTFAPTHPGSSASDVSADGNVIVGMGSGVDADGSGEAFVWFPRRGILDLRRYLLDHGVSAVQSWRLSEAMSVSADGRMLAGWGVDPQGRASAWIARIDIDDAAPPAPLIPAAPTNLIATAAATRVTLQWLDRAGNETGFKVERCAGSNCNQFVEIGQVAANVRSFIDVGVARNSVYRYRVRAFNAAGPSSYSNTVTVRTLRK